MQAVADPEILKRGGENTMPLIPLSQMNIMNNMQFVFAICHGVLAEPEHINCRNIILITVQLNNFNAKKLSLCGPLEANLSITSAASTGIVSACTGISASDVKRSSAIDERRYVRLQIFQRRKRALRSRSCHRESGEHRQ